MRSLWRRLFPPEPKTWIVIVEPSPFRTDETAVIGPMGRRKGIRTARKYLRANPYGEARVVPYTCKVTVDGAVLWPRGPGASPMYFRELPW
jgi:hypothetical protein